jgi:DNA-binding CsgD family transcriptional regulator/tetratricopeptide (TPR) repeat protein
MSSGPRESAPLRGRRSECEALDRLLAGARAGRSQILVLRGEPGVGKTALLNHLSRRATGCRVVRAAGVESEMELAFAGLHQLCLPMLGHVDHLPAPQRDALAVAFGLSAGPPPDRFLVGLAALSLLADVAEREPLICLVDDAHWLDRASAQTLEFVARRLLAESIAIVFAARQGEREHGPQGLPELAVRGLDDADARALLLDALQGPLDAAVLDQIVAESRGNPLALLELPRAWTPSEIAGGFALPDTTSLANRIEQGFLQQLRPLPAPTRQLLLAAAAEPTGDPALLWRAASTLGIGVDAAAPAEAAGLIEFGTRVRFRHPLLRSTAYRSAAPEDRQRAHRALAEATDPVLDPDRRAWHRAHGTSGSDEGVAADLVSSAGRAQARGGLAAAAAFLERAVALTPEPELRASRALAAARAKHQAGAPGDAASLLRVARTGPLDELQQARADLLRAQLAFASSHGRDAPPMLLAAARRLEPLDPGLARDTRLDALAAALFVGRLDGGTGLPEVAAAARTAPSASARPPDLLLEGLATVIADGYPAGAPRLRRAVEAFRTEDLPAPEALRWLWLATHAAHDLWDDEGWEELCARHLRLARQAGALHVLPIALSSRIGLHLFAGELALAASLVDEVAAVARGTGSRLPPYGAAALAAWRGREAEATELIEPILDEVTSRGEGMGLTLLQHARAVLYNGLGRYQEAMIAAEQGAAHPQELAFSVWSLVQLVEAAVRTGQDDRAVQALKALTRTTRPSGTQWALGIEARSRALVTRGDTADRSYREAIDRLGHTGLRMELARARLLYGEWLRRERRRVDAREQLRAAHGAFTAMGAEAFAERARRELLATGETVRTRRMETADELTAQEAQIARLAVAGRTNPEIGAELFLSARTVEWHLRKVFTKLGVTSRKQLRSALPERVQAVAPV